MILDALGGILQAAGIGAVGTDVFLGSLPSSPDDAVALFQYAEEPPLRVYGDHRSTLEQVRVQLMVRSRSYDTAGARAQASWVALEAVRNQVIGGVRYVAVEAISPVGVLERDENDRWAMAANFRVTKESEGW